MWNFENKLNKLIYKYLNMFFNNQFNLYTKNKM